MASKEGGQGARVSSCGTYVWLIRAIITLYVVWLLVRPPSWLDPAMHALWSWPQIQTNRFVVAILDSLGFDAPSRFLRSGTYFLLTLLLLPWAACLLLGRRRPRDTGLRVPNRLLLRIVGCGLITSIPFLIWMVHSPRFLPYYGSYVDAGPLRIAVFYVVVLFCEHFFFQGVILAGLRAGGRWPEPSKVVQDAEAGWRRVAQWFGIAQPTEQAESVTRVTRWLGIPDGCLGAIALSGILFGLAHWGKAGRELVLSFPGGVFLAFLAYRCDSWLAPYLLHAGAIAISILLFAALYL